MTATAQQTPNVFGIKPGDIVSTANPWAGETTVIVTETFEHDGAMYLTNPDGWDHTLYPGDEFRYIHQARR
ncbi:hypothetical protein Q8791_23070 [Nocardiopsis sp. CT-R113]|uniref:Uncharacterized protein n=1 Tax=Nocardiopsis codii TaxID=3065942 RepID=A0ABU7KCY6_9ACTN|nr:hypothetical protein [Nocardiopsis sp. CT-R113]MEE2040103.1 hypothetical protein [Nocardiopsis sp. CT-R113]